MHPGSGQLRCVVAVASAAAAVLLVTGCPTEADDSREIVFVIHVAYRGAFPREPNPQRLALGPVDARALGVSKPTVIDDFGSFRIATSTAVEGDAKFTYCIADPIVITDAGTGREDQAVPAGTCLTEGTTLTVG